MNWGQAARLAGADAAVLRDGRVLLVRNGNTAIERRPHVVQMIKEIIGLFQKTIADPRGFS